MQSGGQRRRRWLCWTVVVAAVGGLGLAGWAVASFLHREPPHPPAFDEARDLPALPPASQNGWAVIAPHQYSFFEPEPPSVIVWSDEGAPPRARWEEMRAELEEWEPAPEVRAVLDDAYARPRFFMACELSLTEDCSVLGWLYADRAASGVALRDASLGWDEEALARAERLLRANRDALSQARTVLGALAASRLTMEAIELTALLGAIVAAREEGAASPVLLEQLDSLERALNELEPESWSFERAIIGEALIIRSAIDTLPASDTGWFGLTPDLARVARLSDEYLRGCIEYARNPARVAPPELPRAGPLWRALDPVGPLLLETLSSDVVSSVDTFEEASTRAERRIVVARAVLAEARARLQRELDRRP